MELAERGKQGDFADTAGDDQIGTYPHSIKRFIIFLKCYLMIKKII